MATRSIKLFLCLFLLLFGATFALGQRDGIPSFVASDVHDFDVVNLSNLVPSFNIPLIQKGAGAIPVNPHDWHPAPAHHSHDHCSSASVIQTWRERSGAYTAAHITIPPVWSNTTGRPTSRNASTIGSKPCSDAARAHAAS